MWIPRPVYEALPYLYGAIGLTFLTVSWVSVTGVASAVLLVAGSGLLLISCVLWLRRKDFRDAQRRYNARFLDDTLSDEKPGQASKQ
jgi:hypothetical protein